MNEDFYDSQRRTEEVGGGRMAGPLQSTQDEMF